MSEQHQMIEMQILSHKEQHEQQLLQEQPSAFKEPEEMLKDSESKEQINSMAKITAGMQSFADQFRSEWDNKDVQITSVMGKVRDFTEDVVLSGALESKFSFKSFAEGKEDGHRVKNRSGSARDLMDSLADMQELTQDKEAKLDTPEALEKMFELSQAASNYVKSHKKKFFWTRGGEARYKVAEKAKKMTSDILQNLLTDKEKEEIYGDGGADFEVGESVKTITSLLERAAKSYQSYTAQLGDNCLGFMPGGEMLRKKLRVLRINDRLMRRYRAMVKKEERDPAIDQMITEYEECLAWEKLRKTTNQKTEGLEEVIDKHLVEEGELEEDENKVEVKDEKEGLTLEQQKGLEEIDNWMLRNYENGINKDGDMIERIFSLSKRERLHIYYLVEKGKRRNSNIVDVAKSQTTYVPDLNEFKGKILASKWKFWKRMNGDYTYTHKISEALQVSKSYRKEFNTLADETKTKTELTKKKNLTAEEKRMSMLLAFKSALVAYGDQLAERDKKKSKREKKAAQMLCNEARAVCVNAAENLRQAYKDLKNKVYMNQAQSKEDQTNEVVENYRFLTEFPNYLDENLGDKLFENGTEGVVQLIGAVTGAITLIKNEAEYSVDEVRTRSLEIGRSLFLAAANTTKVVSQFVGSAGLTMAGTVLKESAPVVGAVLSVGIAISHGVTATHMKEHAQNASFYFDKKRELLEGKMGDLSEERQKELNRELKYEKNMQKLQESLQQRQKTKTVYSSVSAGFSVIGIALPVVGLIGAMGTILVESIHDYYKVENLRTKLFDNFFNLDGLVETAWQERFKNKQNRQHNQDNEEETKKKMKEALRLRVAARMGFNNMKTASVFICSKFAKLIRSKLFEGKDLKDKTNQDLEKQSYIEFVRSLNLDYNEEKKLPSENMLVRKMTAQ